jgi:filamentous hemagglutinin
VDRENVLVPHNNTLLKGSGPVPGVIEISNRSKSTKAFNNYFPSKKVQNTIDFVFDPKTNTFLVGQPKYAKQTSGHPALAEILCYGPRDEIIVAGMFSRGKNGEFLTKESSGHYWQNWNDPIRNQFIEFMKSQGIEMTHCPGR